LNLINTFKKLNSSRLARDSLFQFVLNTIGAIISFFQLPLFLKLMGGNGFGEFVIIQTIVFTFSAFTQIQFYQGILKFSPNASDSINKTSVMMKLGIINEVISLLLVVTGFLIFYGVVNKTYHNLIDINTILPIIVVMTTSISSGQTISTVLRIVDKFQYVAIWSAFCQLLRFVLLLLLPKIATSQGNTLIIALIVPELLRIVALIFLIPNNLISQKWNKPTQFKQMIKFSLTITVQEWCDLPVKQFDKLILSIFVQPMYVGTYHILRRIGTMMAMVVIPFATSFFHEFSERFNSNNVKGVLQLFKKSIVLFSSVSIILAIGLILSESLWVPRLFINVNVEKHLILMIILIYIFINGFNAIHTLLYVLGGIKESLVITFLANALFFISAFYLGYHFKTEGLIISFVIQVIAVIGLKILVVRKKMNQLSKSIG